MPRGPRGRGAADPHDARALDHHAGRPGLERDPRLLHAAGLDLLDVPHLADQTAAGHDLVTLLEIGEQLGVLLPRLARRAQDQEVEHEADRRHLQQQDREPST
jgi:hypothetical protein